MGLRISTNTVAMSTNRMLSQAIARAGKNSERLASGERISHSGDDAAGLSIAENLRAQIRSLSQAERNANQGVSFAQVAEGGLTEISNILIRLRELGVQAASDTVGDKERGIINTEAQSLLQEVDRLASVTTFNRVPLLNGEATKEKLDFQVGIENNESSRMSFDVSQFNSKASALGIDGLNFESIDSSRESFDKVDEAMTRVFQSRASLAATQSNLQSTITNLGIMKENYSSARSQIADTDVAAETTELVKNSILMSAGISVLAQANQIPAQALKLL